MAAVVAVVTDASVVGVTHGSVAHVRVPKASLGSRKEMAPVCGASNQPSTRA